MSTSRPFSDLERPPLRERALHRALGPDGWRLEVVLSAGSTNALVADRACRGEPQGLVVVAESQTAGRGRLDRSWVSPPRAGLTFSVLVRPALSAAQWPWLPLLTGVAVAGALRGSAGIEAVLKWPNDVLVEGRKVCGILVEMPAPGAAVLGIGLNVTTLASELPPAQADSMPATSLRLCGATTTDRGPVLRAVLRSLARTLANVTAAQERYRQWCSSLGTEVRLTLPGGATVRGTAERVDEQGHLVVDGVAYAAGDVVHLRPLSP